MRVEQCASLQRRVTMVRAILYVRQSAITGERVAALSQHGVLRSARSSARRASASAGAS